MGLPRNIYVKDGEQGVYHCFTRCVRGAFLCGSDKITGRDFSHRKEWLLNRLRYLAAIFAIEVIAYAILETHYHNVVRTRPDIAASWSDLEVATRWLMLFPRHRDCQGTPIPPSDSEMRALADCPERITELRRRLSSLSWFMGQLNEFIARSANKEDGVKGRFWESRFKCQALLDDAAITACMVYVDLNPIRAGLAKTPEASDFTSIQARIFSWQQKMANTSAQRGLLHPDYFNSAPRLLKDAGQTSNGSSKNITCRTASRDVAALSDSWLCPIQSDSERSGILQLTTVEYFDLVDKSGRMIRADKPSAIDPKLAPILLRISAMPDTWIKTVSRFGSEFCLAAGLISSLRNFADRLGRRWIKGLTAARIAFASE